MTADELNPFDAVEEELAAYLDGELEPAARQGVEQRLASDPALREKMRRTQSAWDALDLLPRSHADESFARSTVEMTVVDIAREARQTMPALRANWLPWLKLGGVAVLAGVLGFRLVKARQEQDLKTQLRDVLVAEKLELLQDTPSVDFLRELHKANLFAPPPAEHPPSAHHPETP